MSSLGPLILREAWEALPIHPGPFPPEQQPKMLLLLRLNRTAPSGIGAAVRIRTPDLPITNRLLCQPELRQHIARWWSRTTAR